MKKDWLGEKLSEELSDYSSSADFEGLWDRIEAKRRPKKDRRRMLLWFFGLLMLLSSIGLTFWLADSTTHPAGDTSTMTTTYEVDVLNQEVSDWKTEKPASINSSSLQRVPSTPQSSNSSSAATIEPTIMPVTTEQNHSKINLLSIEPEEPTTVALKTPTTPSTKTESSQHPVSSPEVKQTTFSAFPPIPVYPLKEMEAKKADHLSFDPVNPLRSLNRKSILFSIAINRGHFSKDRSLIDPEQETYAQRYDEAEEALDFYAVELGIKKYLTPQLYLQSGIGMTFMTSRFSDSLMTMSTQVLSNQLIKTIFYPDRPPEEVRGDVEVPVEEWRIRTIHNRSRLLHLPLYAGWEFPLSGNWQLGLMTGVRYSYLLQYAGVNYAQSSASGPYRDLQASDYDRRHFFQYSGQLQLRYQLRSRLSTYLGVRLDRSLNRLRHQAIGTEERWQFWGLGAGLEMSW